jgi:hypothetical protein
MTDIAKSDTSSDTQNLFGSDNHYAQMYQMIAGFAVSQIVRAAAVYSMAEHLSDVPRTAQEIAEFESTNGDATFRLMRACASVGLMSYVGDLKFATTPLLRTLHKDDPGSLRDTALAHTGPFTRLPWGNLVEAIKTGKPQTVATLGSNAFEYLSNTPAEAVVFSQVMRRMSMGISKEAADLLDTRSVKVAVDIGGASGILVQELMQRNPSLHGVVFDLPHVMPEAIKAAEALDLGERFSSEAGDFFVSVPPADLYLLKWILHDWDDKSCITILKNCRRAMKPGARLVIVEMVMAEVGVPGIAPLSDLTMLVSGDGRERSLEEYERLLAEAGLRSCAVTATSTPFTLIEAVSG